MAAARPPPRLAVVRGSHRGHSVFAQPGTFPFGKLAVDPRGHGGSGRSAHPAGFHHRLGAVVEDHRARTHALLHHFQPARPGAVARPNRRGRPRLFRIAPSKTLRPMRAGVTAHAHRHPPPQAQEQRDPVHQRHDALDSRGAQQVQPPAAFDPLADRPASLPSAGSASASS